MHVYYVNRAQVQHIVLTLYELMLHYCDSYQSYLPTLYLLTRQFSHIWHL